MARGPSSKAEPKYRQIANALIQEIRSGMKVGDRLQPEVQLAERFNVHVLTIREALRVLQDGGIVQRQRAIGTHVINPLGGQWVSIVSEMDVFSPNDRSLFHRGVIYHLRHFLRDAGLPSRVSIGTSEPGDESGVLTSMDFMADLEANRLAGVLALCTLPDDWWLKKLEKRGVPIVGSNLKFPHSVVFDPWEDLSKAVRRLLDFGRNRIAYVGWLEKRHDVPLDDRVTKALLELEKCYPVTIRKEWIKGDLHPERAGAGWEEFRELWSSFKDKPNGLIIDNEHFLPDIERALQELGIAVPQDLIVISHRTRGNPFTPKFPVIFQENDPQVYAYRMADHFLRLYRNEAVPSASVIVPRLMIDESFALRPAPMQLSPVTTRPV